MPWMITFKHWRAYNLKICRGRRFLEGYSSWIMIALCLQTGLLLVSGALNHQGCKCGQMMYLRQLSKMIWARFGMKHMVRVFVGRTPFISPRSICHISEIAYNSVTYLFDFWSFVDCVGLPCLRQVHWFCRDHFPAQTLSSQTPRNRKMCTIISHKFNTRTLQEP